jgi:hypothetical protein
MSIAHLPERGVVKVAGDDARKFLDGLVTCDLDQVTPERAGYGALLSPQGKIMIDFLIVALDAEDGGGFLLDCPVVLADDLTRRLSLYKLRAKVTVENISLQAAVLAVTDGGLIAPDLGAVFADPRHGPLGDRAIVDGAEAQALASATAEDYEARRIVLGVPAGGKDFPYEGAFPHEALLDQLGGVSFSKGCYVGQEVVSRMEHRGTARNRCVPIRFTDGFRSEWGVEVKAGDRTVGYVGSTARDRGVAMLRLDRIADGMAAGEPLLAGGLAIELVKEPFIGFPLPGEAGFGAGQAG